jgi:hypothetical protein
VEATGGQGGGLHNVAPIRDEVLAMAVAAPDHQDSLAR